MRKYKITVRKTTFQETEVEVEDLDQERAVLAAIDVARADKHPEWIRYDDSWKATLAERLDLQERP